MTQNIEFGIDLQKMHDDLVVLRDSLTAQIKAMEDSGRVCSHPQSELAMETLHENGPRGKSYTVCKGCGLWVPVERE